MSEENISEIFIANDALDLAADLSSRSSPPVNDARWTAEHHEEGQLAVDVLETKEDLVVIATMAGAKSEDIEVHLQNDCLTIRGQRRLPVADAARWFYEECYWGKFSRTIVLPADVKSDMARSEYRNGVLIVYLPKVKAKSDIPILVVEE